MGRGRNPLGQRPAAPQSEAGLSAKVAALQREVARIAKVGPSGGGPHPPAESPPRSKRHRHPVGMHGIWATGQSVGAGRGQPNPRPIISCWRRPRFEHALPRFRRGRRQPAPPARRARQRTLRLRTRPARFVPRSRNHRPSWFGLCSALGRAATPRLLPSRGGSASSGFGLAPKFQEGPHLGGGEGNSGRRRAPPRRGGGGGWGLERALAQKGCTRSPQRRCRTWR